MEPILHLLLPVLFLLAVSPQLEKKYVFGLAFATFIMDLDIYLPAAHRFLFHSLLFVIVFSLLIRVIWNATAAYVAVFYTFSHLIFDFGLPGVAFFYPFIQKTFYINVDILWNKGLDLVIFFGSLTKEEYLTLMTDTTKGYLHTQGLLVTLLLLILVTVKTFRSISSKKS